MAKDPVSQVLAQAGKRDQPMRPARDARARRQSCWRRFCEQTTLHGFQDAAEAPSAWLHYFWLCIIAVFAVAVAVTILVIVGEYRAQPLVTTYRLISVGNLSFPSVELCIGDTINSSKARGLGISPQLVGQAKAQFVSPIAYIVSQSAMERSNRTTPLVFQGTFADAFLARTKEEAMATIVEARQLLPDGDGDVPTAERLLGQVETHLAQVLRIDNYDAIAEAQRPNVFQLHHDRLLPFLTDSGDALDVEKLISHIGMDFDQVVVNCLFVNRRIDCKKAMRPVFDQAFGHCFLLEINQQQTIPSMGLTLLVTPKLQMNWPKPASVDETISVRIEHGYNPGSVDQINIYPGSLARIRLQATYYDLSKSERYGLCLTDFPRKISTYPYTDAVCTLECFHQAIFARCGCTLLIPKQFQKDPTSFRSCPVSKIGCIEQVQLSEYATCQQACRPRCQYWKYTPSVSYSKFPSRALYTHMRSLFDDEDDKPLFLFDENVTAPILLDIAFGEMQYTVVAEHEIISVFGLICQIGGDLGLFLGASFMSFIQLAVLAFTCRCCKPKRTRPREQTAADQH